MIKIKACYSWYEVYVNNTMVLEHVFQKYIDDLIRVLHETNTPYILDLKDRCI